MSLARNWVAPSENASHADKAAAAAALRPGFSSSRGKKKRNGKIITRREKAEYSIIPRARVSSSSLVFCVAFAIATNKNILRNTKTHASDKRDRPFAFVDTPRRRNYRLATCSLRRTRARKKASRPANGCRKAGDASLLGPRRRDSLVPRLSSRETLLPELTCITRRVTDFS